MITNVLFFPSIHRASPDTVRSPPGEARLLSKITIPYFIPFDSFLLNFHTNKNNRRTTSFFFLISACRDASYCSVFTVPLFLLLLPVCPDLFVLQWICEIMQLRDLDVLHVLPGTRLADRHLYWWTLSLSIARFEEAVSW